MESSLENYEEAFQSICRVCLTPNCKNMVPLFDKTSENNLSCFGTAVLTFASISITSDDKLPPKMCQNCLFVLKQAIKFKLKCENSQKQLSNLILRQKERDLKEKIIEYTIFMQYFPTCTNRQENSTTLLNGKEESSDEDNNLLESDDDIPILDNEMFKSDTDENETPNITNILGIQNKETKTQGDEDEMLEMIEKLVNCNKRTLNLHVRREKKTVQFKNKIKRVGRMIRKKMLVKRPVPEPHQCEVCRKVLANKRTYDSHMQKHNGYRYICEQCGKGLPGNAELQFHLVARHGTGNYLQCEHCSFKAARRYDLIEHSRLHTGERPYTCDQCGLTFRRRGIWRKHRVYHQDKSFQCTQCPRRFHLRSDLAAHANNVHRRVYVYMCTRCDATYAKPATVRRHLAERHGVPREMQGKVIRINRSDAAAAGGQFTES